MFKILINFYLTEKQRLTIKFMEQNNTYKYLSIILAIIAVIFAVLYFTKPSEPVTETISDVSAEAAMCRDNIAAWRQANSNMSTTSEQARAELMTILEECEEILADSQERI